LFAVIGTFFLILCQTQRQGIKTMRRKLRLDPPHVFLWLDLVSVQIYFWFPPKVEHTYLCRNRIKNNNQILFSPENESFVQLQSFSAPKTNFSWPQIKTFIYINIFQLLFILLYFNFNIKTLRPFARLIARSGRKTRSTLRIFTTPIASLLDEINVIR